MSACRWNGTGEPRTLPGRHDDDCAGECPGCLPCPGPHCVVCGRNHADATCPECVGATRDDLEAVEDMHHRLRAEAIARGVSGDRGEQVLGGDAMVMLAMRHPDQTGARAVTHEHEREADPIPPLLVLAGWEDVWRDYLDHPTDATATVPDAIRYLDQQLTYMAGVVDVPFDDFAREVRQLRARLEGVLHDGEQTDTGAPCMKCRIPLQLRHGATAREDRWRCPRCRQESTPEQYLFSVQQWYREEADALTLTDLALQYGTKSGTVMVWASRGEVRKRGKDEAGRQLYDVADVRRMMRHDARSA